MAGSPDLLREARRRGWILHVDILYEVLARPFDVTHDFALARQAKKVTDIVDDKQS